MKIIPCMGGWCGQRENCARYRQTASKLTPAERLCERGHDEPEPIKVMRAPRVEQREAVAA